MRPIDFNDLPRTTRELFVRSLVSDSPTAAPICRRISPTRTTLPWWVLFFLSLAGAAGVTVPKFGSVLSPVQGRVELGIYVALFSLIGLALSMVMRRRALKGSLPFTPGVYVFPMDLVDARTRELELYPLAELQSIDPVHHQTNGQYTHTSLWFVFPEQSFVFEIRDRVRAERELAAITHARQSLANAFQQNNYSNYDASTFDPFAEARMRNWEPAHDHGLLARGRPLWTSFVWAITIVTGLVVGVASWRLRNWQSDERAYAKLRAKPDVLLGEAYLRGGGLHTADVKNVILPRARLEEAKKETVTRKRAEAFDRFLRTYPKTAVDAEARGLLAESLHTEFLAQTTVAGLRAFIAHWPDSPDLAAAKAKMHEMHQQTLVDFRQHANMADKNVVPVMEAMLTWSEDPGTPIEVRFRKRNASALTASDKLLAKGLLDDDGAAAKGGNAQTTSYFSGDALVDREAGLTRALERGFARVFPADIFSFRVGAPLDANTKAPLPDVTTPTIIVDYEIGWSGTTYVSRDQSRRFVGFFVKFDLSLQAPKEPKVLSFAMKAEPPDSFGVDAASAPPPPADVDAGAPKTNSDDGRVYDAMMLRAFEQMTAKLMTVVFDARTATSRAPPDPL